MMMILTGTLRACGAVSSSCTSAVLTCGVGVFEVGVVVVNTDKPEQDSTPLSCRCLLRLESASLRLTKVLTEDNSDSSCAWRCVSTVI